MSSGLLFSLFFITGAVLSAFLFVILFIKKEREIAMLKSQITSPENFRKLLKDDFALIAAQTIKTEQEDLRKQNREALEEKIMPLAKELNEFKEKVDKFNISGVENTTRIIEQISSLEKNSKNLEQEARNLTQALTKNQNVKGAYGEEILETLLQHAGMQEGIHYKKQYSTTSENLNDETIHNIRPDVIINLPNNRHLVIDSKVTLSSYIDCIKDSTKIKDFKSEVKSRIHDLAGKNYQNAANTNQPDFILMYLPIDSSIALLYEDNDIINYAYQSNVIIAGTSSLLAIIRLVNQLYAQQKQNENVQEIVKAGTNLYETFVQFSEELIMIKKALDSLSQQFTTTINRFNRTNKNKPSMFSQINELKRLGINSNKNIPEDILETAEGVLTND